MLRITVPPEEFFDEEKQEFIEVDGCVLELEHSLVSLSKWESMFEKPFLSAIEKSPEEVMTYVETMILNPVYPEGVVRRLTPSQINEITKYMDSKMTATWFNDAPNAPKSKEVITAELIYYWMVAFQIPFEAENWHLSRLFTLIKVCNAKSSKPKKMSRSEIAARNRELNAQRKKQLGTNG